MVTAFASFVSELKGTIKPLREQINRLQTHLNYYKELNEAFITVINDLVSSRQQCTLLSKSNLG
jgi:hypothetical protein